MLSAYSGSGQPGTFSLAPYPIQSRNFSHIQELYQNLPQLNRHFIVPYSQTTSQEYNMLPTRIYSESEMPYPKQKIEDKLLQHKVLQQYEGEITNIHKRNGRNGWDGGDVGGGWSSNTKTSSQALSALALLGFMFFLNLIQTSLQNNRQMLAAAALNSTTVGIIAGRSGRERRDSEHLHHSLETDLTFLKNTNRHTTQDNWSGSETQHHGMTQPDNFMKRDRPSSLGKQEFIPKQQNITVNPIKDTSPNATATQDTMMTNIKSTSLECFQLIACKLGKSIYGNLDGTMGLMVRMLGASVIPRIPRKTWTGRLVRAFDKGWRSQHNCERLFQKCGFLNFLNFNTSNIMQAMRKKKSKESLSRRRF